MTTTQTRLPLFILLIMVAASVALFGFERHPASADGDELIVVSIGDSVASGEGAPDKPTLGAPLPATWSGGVSDPTPTTCHRSSKAGPALAYYERIKNSYPNSTFVHFACSGAGIVDGLLQSQLNDNGTVRVAAPQLDQVQSWMAANRPGRRIDALFVSGGANDIRFDKIVERCITDFSCQKNPAFADQVASSLAALDARYDYLATRIQTSLNPVKVFVTEYFDPMRKTPNRFCDGEPPLPEPLSGISGDEARWGSQTIVATLNAKIREAAQRNAVHGWQVVSGLAADFAGHGWCASERWVNTATDSALIQADHLGMVHPNYRGHQAYRDRIAKTFSDTYPLLSPVRLSLSASAYNSHELKWEDHSASETRYEVQVTDGGTVSTVTLPADSTSWVHSGLTTGHTYAYRVRVCNNGGCKDWSNQVTRTVPEPPSTSPIPAAPSNLTHTLQVINEREIHTLSWTLNSSNQTQILLKYQKAGTTTWTTVTLDATTTQYQLGQAFQAGQTYTFYVQACNSYGCSAQSNTIEVPL